MPDQAEFRVGAHVDEVNGYPNCLLAITPDAVSITLSGRLARLFHPRMAGSTVVHQGGELTLARIRWQVPWRRVALLLFDDEHRVVVPMSRTKAVRIVDALRACGHEVGEVFLGPFDGPWSLVALEQYRYNVRRRGRSG